MTKNILITLTLVLSMIVGKILGESWSNSAPYNREKAIALASQNLNGSSKNYKFLSADWQEQNRYWLVKFQSTENIGNCFNVKLDRESITTYYSKCE